MNSLKKRWHGILAVVLLASGCGGTMEEEAPPPRPMQTVEQSALGCTPYSITRVSGVADGYSTANGIESPSPSAGLRQFVANNYYYSTIRNHDSGELDRFFAHTFTGLAPSGGTYMCGASLAIRMRSGDYNDGMNLLFTNSSGGYAAGYWYRRLSDLGISYGQDKTVNLSLGSLQTSTGYDLLYNMSLRGYLDLYVQDDSAVDYTRLDVQYCCATTCGDGVCGAGESAWSCPEDCAYCGDGICSPGESGWCSDCGVQPCLSGNRCPEPI